MKRKKIISVFMRLNFVEPNVYIEKKIHILRKYNLPEKTFINTYSLIKSIVNVHLSIPSRFHA